MSTTVAIAAAANANAAAANSAAQEVARKACMTYVKGYEHDRATVAEMQEYAGCITRLYPNPMEPGEVMIWKVVIVVLLIGMFAGIFKAWKDPYYGRVEAVLMGALCGAAIAFLVMVVVAGVFFGIRFLVT